MDRPTYADWRSLLPPPSRSMDYPRRREGFLGRCRSSTSAVKPTYICGSTFISTYHLLTAAHCMYNHNGKRGAADLLTGPDKHNVDNFAEWDIQLRDVVSFFVHRDYNSDDYGTELDIALLVLRLAIVYNHLVRPICLWNRNDEIEDIVGKSGLVSGWGITVRGPAKTPNYVNLTVVNECREQLGRNVVPFTFFADGGGAVLCNSDSGSGFAFKRGSRFFLREIVSVGQFDRLTLLCDRRKYVVFTDFAPLRYWVLDYVRSFSASSSWHYLIGKC